MANIIAMSSIAMLVFNEDTAKFELFIIVNIGVLDFKFIEKGQDLSLIHI